MKKGQDITVEFPYMTLIHQKVPGRELGRHVHKEHELFIPLQGEITVSYGEKVLHCGAGKMLFIPAGLDHSFSSSASGHGERIICLLSKKLLSNKNETDLYPSVLPLNSLIRELAFYLLINSKSVHTKTFIKALSECLLDTLSFSHQFKFDDITHIEGKIQDIRVKKAFCSILESSEEITVTELAKQSGLSLRNLNKLFVTEVGVTPKNLMVLKKINQAKELLLTTNLTITDIGFEVGYSSLSKFISMFQKVTGKLPSEFRLYRE